MRPQHFPHLYYSESRDDLRRGRTHEMLDEMSDLVHSSCMIVIARWEELAGYFDGLLAEKRGLLDPAYHDSLLTDDKAFTRSKKYFWAIEFLQEAEAGVLNNIAQVGRFLELLETNPPISAIAENTFRARVRRHLSTLRKLEDLKTRFRMKQDEAKALRDGVGITHACDSLTDEIV